MIIKLIRNICLTILSVVIVFATTGFSLISHYCSNENISSVRLSLSIDNNCCNGMEQSCCDEESKSCCSEKSKAPSESPSTKKKCCEKEFTFLKTSTYLLINPSKDKIISVLITSFIRDTDIIFESDNPKTHIIENINLPPPIYGRSLLTFIHQFKTDPSIA